MQKNLFIRASYRQATERTPVWMMRQAGRYLPQYQALRQKYDFMTLYKTPELAAEVSLQPVEILGVDAAIVFSDILVVPEAMGMKLQFSDDKGPIFANPVKDEQTLATLGPGSLENLSCVFSTVRLVKDKLAGKIPVIGFCGAPWTVASFMIEGCSSHQFNAIKKWRFARPDLLHRLLDRLADTTILYCKSQIEAGADALQLFDPLAGLIDTAGFHEFILPSVHKILRAIRVPGIPLIYFSKGTGQWLADIASIEADVIGVDWTVSLATARQTVGDCKAIQGNLDPAALYAPPDAIYSAVERMLHEFGYGNGHIANLGHGIPPDTPLEHAQAFVQAVKELSQKFHRDITRQC